MFGSVFGDGFGDFTGLKVAIPVITPKFFLDPSTLSDPYGNVAEVLSGLNNRTVKDYTGTLHTVAATKHRFVGSRVDGSGNYFTDDGAGSPLHPSKVVDGATYWLTKQDWATGAWAAGSACNNGGKWYSTVAGGTDTATFGDGITWVEQGIYQRDFGVLVEGASANALPATNWRTAAYWLVGWGGANVTLAQQTNGDLGVDGTANAEVIITDGDATLAIAAFKGASITSSTNTHWLCIPIRKNSATNIPHVHVRLGGGTAVVGDAHIDTATGLLSNDSPAGSFVAEKLYHWVVHVPVTDNGSGNSALHALIYPAGRATLNGADDGTLTGSITVDWPQVELNTASPSSLMAGGTTRTTEMGAIKWSSANLPSSGSLTWHIDWCPEFASSDLSATALRALLTFNNSAAQFLRQDSSATDAIAVSDGANAAAVNIGAWSRGDCIALTARADLTNSLMYLSYANKSNGAAVTHVAAVAYDGAFTDTGFFQLLMAGGGNNSVFRNIMGYDKFLSNADIESRFYA